MSKHTPGPWSLSHEKVSIGPGYNCHRLYISSGDKDVTGTMGHINKLTKYATEKTIRELRGQPFPTLEEDEEPEYTPDMRRIVACVNACEGINPEAVPQMLSDLESIYAALEEGRSIKSFDRAWIKHTIEKAIPKTEENK